MPNKREQEKKGRRDSYLKNGNKRTKKIEDRKTTGWEWDGGGARDKG